MSLSVADLDVLHWGLSTPVAVFETTTPDGKTRLVLQRELHARGIVEPGVVTTEQPSEGELRSSRNTVDTRPAWSPTTGASLLSDDEAHAYTFVYGWPMASLAADLLPSDRAPYYFTARSGIELRGLTPLRTLSHEFPRVIPTRPIVSGFVVNTLSYTPITFGLVMLHSALQRLRAKKRTIARSVHHCSWCCYDMGGCTRCPECGQTGDPPARCTSGGVLIGVLAPVAAASTFMSVPFIEPYEAATGADGRWVFLLAPLAVSLLGGLISSQKLRRERPAHTLSRLFDVVYSGTLIIGGWAVLMLGIGFVALLIWIL